MSTVSVSHVTSSFFTVGGETTSGKILIPSTVTPGHDLYVMVASRGHSDAVAYPTVTDTDSAGNTFVLEGATASRKGTLFWKKATSGTSGKLITIAGASQSCSGVLSVYSGGLASGDPTTNLAAETNNLGSNTHAAFTPSNASSMICFAAYQYTGTPTLSMSSMSCTEIL